MLFYASKIESKLEAKVAIEKIVYERKRILSLFHTDSHTVLNSELPLKIRSI